MKIKGSGDEVETIKIINSKMSKQITPLKILLDVDSEIRATNIHGTTKTGRTMLLIKLYLREQQLDKEASI